MRFENNSMLDPSKTQITISYTNNSNQFVENRYKSFKNMTLETENGIEYHIHLTGKWVRQGSESVFTKSRHTLSHNSLSTAMRTNNNTNSFGDGTRETIRTPDSVDKKGLVKKEKGKFKLCNIHV